MVFYLTFWFTSTELSSRIAMFFSTSAVAGVVGGLLAYGILQLEGAFGLHGWQLLFLVEGVPTILSGISVYYLLPNEPLGAAFLTPAEQRFAVERLVRARALSSPSTGTDDAVSASANATAAAPNKKEISWADMRQTLSDWRVWALSILYLFILITLYSLSFFLPAIIGQFGYSVLTSNLLSVPIYAVAALFTVYISLSSDRRNERFLHCAIPSACACVCFVAMAGVIDSDRRALKYVLLMALVAFSWCLVPPLLALLMSMLKGPTSRYGDRFVCSCQFFLLPIHLHLLSCCDLLCAAPRGVHSAYRLATLAACSGRPFAHGAKRARSRMRRRAHCLLCAASC